MRRSSQTKRVQEGGSLKIEDDRLPSLEGVVEVRTVDRYRRVGVVGRADRDFELAERAQAMLRQASRGRLFDGPARAFERAGVREHVERDDVVNGDAPKNPEPVPLDISLSNCGHALGSLS